MRKIYLATCVLAVLLVSSRRASADTVPAAIIGASLSYGTSITSPGTATSIYCIPFGGCESWSVSVDYMNGTATMSGNGYTTPDPTNGEDIQGNQDIGHVDFWFMVSGPGNIEIPLVLSASGTAAASGAGGIVSEALVQINGQWAGGSALAEACATSDANSSYCADGSAGLRPSSFSGQTQFSVLSNTPEEMVVSGFGATFEQYYPEGSGSWSFSVDPMITFGPGFDSTGYSIEFSASPPSATPEPGSLVLLGTALFGLGFTLRQRQAWRA